MDMDEATKESIRRMNEWGEQSDRYYEDVLREQVETPENIGKLLLLDVETKRYVIGDRAERRALFQKLQPTNPAAVAGIRIGYPAVTGIGYVVRPYTEEERMAWRKQKQQREAVV